MPRKGQKLSARVWLLTFQLFQVAEHTLLLSNQWRLQVLRLRVAAKQVYRCLNNKGIVLDLTNYFISAPEEGLQCLLTSTKLLWFMLHCEKEPRERVADGKHVEH